MQAADVKLPLPRAEEACPMGRAPTTSTTMMLALGDALAVALMERRGFGADQYRDVHPGGSLGRGLIRVGDLMHQGAELPLVTPDAAMRDVIVKMTSGGSGFAGVVGVIDDKGLLTGIITDGDVRRHVERDLLDRKAKEVMTANPRIVPPGMLAAEALALMNDGTPKVTSLFVVEDGKPVGILTVHDCLRAGLQ
jgi:arabinose-5-phosphate isomerase